MLEKITKFRGKEAGFTYSAVFLFSVLPIQGTSVLISPTHRTGPSRSGSRRNCISSSSATRFLTRRGAQGLIWRVGALGQAANRWVGVWWGKNLMGPATDLRAPCRFRNGTQMFELKHQLLNLCPPNFCDYKHKYIVHTIIFNLFIFLLAHHQNNWNTGSEN